MGFRTVAIGRREFDLLTITSSRQALGHARSMHQADVPARSGHEIVVMGDDAAQLVPLRDLDDAATGTRGRSSSARHERTDGARRAPRFGA